MKTNCEDFHKSEKNKSITCHQIEPMSLTSLVTTNLIGITRGRSLPQSDLDKYYEIGCG
jgi:glutamine synthetase